MPLHALLVSSVQQRPYVFVFLLAYVLIAANQLGWLRMLLFALVGFGVAWAAEYVSSQTAYGVPFGPYRYTGATRNVELFLLGVPFFDSLSFVFLAFASYSMSLFFCMHHTPAGIPLQFEDDPDVRQSASVLLMSALFMTWLDLVIDPLAVRGDEWFLGHVFDYPEPGIFFGVPLSNFLGWFFVAMVIVGLYQRLDALLIQYQTPGRRPRGIVTPDQALLGPLLWWGILGFNVVIAFFLQKVGNVTTLLFPLVAVLLHVPIAFFFGLRLLGGATVASGRGFEDVLGRGR
ncbi:MAG: carotenoid biosynthesis protein [Planctomycetes bacterium]|nr:carotenoid biosynthesis protein [Planctomycetota bacterium]